MTQNLPIQMKEVINLTQAGFDPSLIKLGTLSFESDLFICAQKILKTQSFFRYTIWTTNKN